MLPPPHRHPATHTIPPRRWDLVATSLRRPSLEPPSPPLSSQHYPEDTVAPPPAVPGPPSVEQAYSRFQCIVFGGWLLLFNVVDSISVHIPLVIVATTSVEKTKKDKFKELIYDTLVMLYENM
jgi:hypothetical protein